VGFFVGFLGKQPSVYFGVLIWVGVEWDFTPKNASLIIWWGINR